MSEKKEQAPAKRPYEKPRLRTIALAAEEVLAVGCKFTDSGQAPMFIANCVELKCAAAGS